MAEIAKEAGHWYNKDGSPQHTTIGKNGKERPTTLRDARKLNLVPSVTQVLNILDKPGLNIWKENQILMSALTLPAREKESLDEYALRVKEDAKKQSEQARDKGTKIHGEHEKYFSGYGCEDDYLEMCKHTEAEIFKVFGEYQFFSEKSFSHPLGYGGKVDLHNSKVVLDLKTTEFTADRLPPGWPDQCWQLSAYCYGLGSFRRAANVYISTSVDGLVHIREWSEAELKAGLDVFLAALELWKRIKKYRSEYGKTS